MPAETFLLPFRPAIDPNGLTVSGAQLFFYASGTSTPQNVYADEALTVPLMNPVMANAAGKWPTITLDNTLVYRVVLRDGEGTILAEADPYVVNVTDPLEADLQAFVDAAASQAVNAGSQALNAAEQVNLAAEQVDLAAQQAAAAGTSAGYAEEFFAGISYNSLAEGEAATAPGHFFRVPIPATDPVEYTRYQRTVGGSVEAAPLLTTSYAASPAGAGALGIDGGGTVQDTVSAFSSTASGVFSQSGVGKKAFFRRAQGPTVGLGTRGTRYWCCVPRSTQANSAYLLHELRRANLNASGSVGVNAELLRVTSTFKVARAWIGRHDYSAVSDVAHWPATAFTVAGNTTLYQHLQLVNEYYSSASAAGTAGRWIEFNVPFNGDGEANLQFYCTPGSANDAQITIDGGTPETVRLSSATAQIYRHKLRAAPGFHTVRVTKPTALTTLNVFGANYGDAATYPGFSSPGGFCAWGNGDKFTNDEGASDYAIYDVNSGLYAGSFHAGELLKAEDFIIDGLKVDPMAAIVSCDTLEIVQQTQIDWPDYKVANEAAMLALPAVAGTIALRADTGETWVRNGGATGTISDWTQQDGLAASSLICHSSQLFVENSGNSMSYVFSENPAVPGGVLSGTFYTAMHTTPERFTEVVAPEYLNLAGLPDGFKSLARSDVVVQSSPTTGERITIQVALDNSDYIGNIYGGPTVRKVTGSYNKLYYGPLISAPTARQVTKMRGGFRKQFAG